MIDRLNWAYNTCNLHFINQKFVDCFLDFDDHEPGESGSYYEVEPPPDFDENCTQPFWNISLQATELRNDPTYILVSKQTLSIGILMSM